MKKIQPAPESKFLEDQNSVFGIPQCGFLNKHQSAMAEKKEQVCRRQIQRGQLFCF